MTKKRAQLARSKDNGRNGNKAGLPSTVGVSLAQRRAFGSLSGNKRDCCTQKGRKPAPPSRDLLVVDADDYTLTIVFDNDGTLNEQKINGVINVDNKSNSDISFNTDISFVDVSFNILNKDGTLNTDATITLNKDTFDALDANDDSKFEFTSNLTNDTGFHTLEPGSKLQLIFNTRGVLDICGNHKVDHNGKDYSMSTNTKKVKQLLSTIVPAGHGTADAGQNIFYVSFNGGKVSQSTKLPLDETNFVTNPDRSPSSAVEVASLSTDDYSVFKITCDSNLVGGDTISVKNVYSFKNGVVGGNNDADGLKGRVSEKVLFTVA